MRDYNFRLDNIWHDLERELLSEDLAWKSFISTKVLQLASWSGGLMDYQCVGSHEDDNKILLKTLNKIDSSTTVDDFLNKYMVIDSYPGHVALSFNTLYNQLFKGILIDLFWASVGLKNIEKTWNYKTGFVFNKEAFKPYIEKGLGILQQWIDKSRNLTIQEFLYQFATIIDVDCMSYSAFRRIYDDLYQKGQLKITSAKYDRLEVYSSLIHYVAENAESIIDDLNITLSLTTESLLVYMRLVLRSFFGSTVFNKNHISLDISLIDLMKTKTGRVFPQDDCDETFNDMLKDLAGEYVRYTISDTIQDICHSFGLDDIDPSSTLYKDIFAMLIAGGHFSVYLDAFDFLSIAEDGLHDISRCKTADFIATAPRFESFVEKINDKLISEKFGKKVPLYADYIADIEEASRALDEFLGIPPCTGKIKLSKNPISVPEEILAENVNEYEYLLY